MEGKISEGLLVVSRNQVSRSSENMIHMDIKVSKNYGRRNEKKELGAKILI